tara:strand:- start:3608 stop:3778 length:171 start_codon:yes stop_codon:yes gene_type:complete
MVATYFIFELVNVLLKKKYVWVAYTANALLIMLVLSIIGTFFNVSIRLIIAGVKSL